MLQERQQANYSNWSLIKDLADYIRPYRAKFVWGTLLRLSCDLANLYPAIAMASIVTFFSKYSIGQSLRPVWMLLAFWGVAFLIRNLGKHSSKFFIYFISEKVAIDAQMKAVNNLFQLDIAWHEKENAGNKMKKFQRGGYGIDRIIRMWVDNYIEIAVNLIGIVYILSISDRIIGVSLSLFMFIYFVLSFVLLRRAKSLVRDVNDREEEINGLVFQSINNIRSVKVLNIFPRLAEMIWIQMDGMYVQIKKRITMFQVKGITLDLWSLVFRLGSLAFIIYNISQGRAELGFIILYNTYFLRMLESVDELAASAQDLMINKIAVSRMQELINEPTGEFGYEHNFASNWQKISVKNVSFSYGENQVLKNISFDIYRGERIGIVGLSGAGKSTMFKLLLKENEGFTGDILFDDISIKNINKKSYYENVGVVLQDTEVFNFSLRDNITIVSDKTDEGDQKLNRAIDISYVSDFLPKLPLGLDTFIGEKGVKLSGGERQRLGIARAIYKQPQILFLDEATSSLDLESEEKIQHSLQQFFQEVTAVVIAHRLTTIRAMDRILVINGGQIVEQGSFDELQQKQGRFYDLWQKQRL